MMHSGSARSSLVLLVMAALAGGCDDPSSNPDAADRGIQRDRGGGDRGAADDGVFDRGRRDDGVPDRDVPDRDVPDRDLSDGSAPDDGLPDTGLPDTGLPTSGAPYVELCVGCGTATSPRYRLVDHALRPIEAPAPQSAASPRYRLILDPR